MRTHYVNAFPELRKNDRDWIEAYRARHDPVGKRMASPHITFGFAIEGMTDKAVVDEVTQRASGQEPIDFELTHASMSYNPFREFYQEYLVPEKGHAAMVRLHDRLYSGAFAPQLRLDIGYIPHISIGRCEHPHRGKERVDALNKADISIKGHIGALEVMAFQDGEMSSIASIPLLAR